MNDVMQLMQRHVSVRSFTGEAIEPEVLHHIIRCGQSAASSSFIQAYSIIRVTDPEKRRVISEAAGHQSWIEEAAEFMVLCADLNRVNYASNKSGQGDLEGFTEHFLTATVDTALMAQNMLLAAQSYGLGGVFIGGIRNNPAVVADCLELPKYVYPAFGLCLGWPAARNPVKPRLPVEAIVHENRYDKDAVAAHVDKYDDLMTVYYGGRPSNAKSSNWSAPTTRAVQGKRREHMLAFLQERGFLKK